MKGDGSNKKSPSKAGEGNTKSLHNSSSFIRKGEHKERLMLADRFWHESERVVGRWLIHEIIPSKGAGMLHGLSGSYKTYVALDIACHIASGIDFHGMRTEQGTVIYLAGEGVNGMKKRIKAWADIHQDVSPSVLTGNILFLNSVCIGSLKVNKENTEFKQLIEDIGNISSNVKLIIIDTQSVFNEGDENREETAKNFVNSCKHASVALGCSVLFIHHDCIRSSNYLPYADFSFHIKGRKPMKVELEIEKMREAASGTSFIVSLQEVEFEAGYGSSLAVKDCSSSSR